MAKSKSKSKKLVLEEEVLEESADVQDEDVQDEEVQDDEIPEEPGDDQEGPDDGETPPASPLKPKLSKTTMAFILLNFLIVPAFVTFAYLDYIVRVQYSYRTLLNYVIAWGLPLRSEKDLASASSHTRPQMSLTPGQLSDALSSRKGKAPREPFATVDEPVPLRLQPSDLTDVVLRDIFGDMGDPVRTQEDEVERLKKVIPDQIDQAAKEVRAKLKPEDEKEKRDAVRKTLLPLAWDVWQVKKLEDKIVKAKGTDLDTLLDESVQRRIYKDILAPINVFRPGNLSKFNIEKIADLDGYSLDKLKEYLDQRFSAVTAETYNPEHHLGEVWEKEKKDPDALKRDTIERRQNVAFLLFTLSQVEVKLLDNRKIYPKGVERSQIICGLRECTTASVFYVQAMRILEERIAQAVVVDRQGQEIPLNDELRTKMKIADKDFQRVRLNGFIDRYETEVDRLVKLVEYIDFARKRIEDLSQQQKHLVKQYDQRAMHHKDTLDKLLAARKNTEKLVKELRQKQDELHEAQKTLSNAADRNIALEAFGKLS